MGKTFGKYWGKSGNFREFSGTFGVILNQIKPTHHNTSYDKIKHNHDITSTFPYGLKVIYSKPTKTIDVE